MERKKMGQRKKISRSRKRRFAWFTSSEAQCHRRLERLRWPHGPWCPSCRARRISRFPGRGKTGKKRRLYTCLACRYQFTLTAGTFLHDSHLPLRKWFEAIFVICSAPKQGVRSRARYVWFFRRVHRRTGRWLDPPPKRLTARRLQSELKLGSYKTAWLLMRRIRRARQRGDALLGKIARLGRRTVVSSQLSVVSKSYH